MNYKKLKIAAFVILLMLFTISCNLFAQNNNEATNLDAAIQKAVIETKAASTLVAANEQATEAAANSGDSDDQVDGEPTNTDVPATDAPDATATPTETPTPTQTPTATLTPTPEPPPDDPTIGLGDPDFEDNFDNPAYWLVFDSADSNLVLQDSQLRYTNKIANNFTLWRASWPTIQDYYLDVVAEVPGDCSGKDEWGFLFRTPEATKGHLFTVTCDGFYRLRLWDGTDMDVLVARAESEHINTGSGAVNRIGVKAVDEEIRLYVNGHLLATVISNVYDQVGPYGVTTNSVNTANLTVHFSELRYWDLAD
jgi:hypothetical protein